MDVEGAGLAVVVLAHDSGDLLVRAVESVLAQTRPCELLVVDNGSTDGAVADLRERHPGIRVHVLDQNLGYARGMNLGIAEVGGAAVVPMNDDAVLAPDFAEVAMRVLAARPTAGVVAPLVVRAGADGVDWSGGSFTLDAGPQRLSRSLRVVADPPPDHGAWCVKANGACPVIRRSAVDAVVRAHGEGPFDPVFDTYGEDVDLAFALHRLGWRTWFAPEVRAAHTTSAGSAVSVADKRGRLRTNLVAARHRNAWRHLSASDLLRTWPLVVAGDVGFVVRQWLQGDRGALGDVGRAWARVARERDDLRAYRAANGPVRDVRPAGRTVRSTRTVHLEEAGRVG